MVYCIVANAGGTEAGVGTSWAVCHSQSATDNPTFYAQISLSAAEILALFTTPKQIVAAPGAGKIILPISIVYNFTYNSIAYATNVLLGLKQPSSTCTDLIVISGTANQIQFIATSLLPGYSNEALQVAVKTGNPTAGNSTVTFGVYYKIHTL